MQIETHSKTQSFKASDIASLDEMIDEWSERNQRVITNIALLYIPQVLNDNKVVVEEQIQAIITYNIKQNLAKPNDL